MIQSETTYQPILATNDLLISDHFCICNARISPNRLAKSLDHLADRRVHALAGEMQKNTGANLQRWDKIELLGISTHNSRDVFKMVGRETAKRIEAELLNCCPARSMTS